MKIIILYPEMYEFARFKGNRIEFPPFGPMVLASILEQEGHSVLIKTISNTDYSLDLTSFDVIAFSISASASFDLFKKCMFKSQIDKENQLLIAGGIHSKIFPEQVLEELDIHAACYGEGEKIILDLIKVKKNLINFQDVSSIVYWDSSKNIVKTPISSAIHKSFRNIIPARHLLKEKDLIMYGRLPDSSLRLAHVLFTRGCDYGCSFCAVAKSKMEYRNGLSCREELIELQKIYGIQGFSIVDDNFISNKTKVKNICDSIRDLNLKWSALCRVDVINDNILEMLVDAGCIELKFGVESGDENMLNRMNKNININKILTALKLSKKYGVHTTVLIMHGFPGENLSSTKNTINLLSNNLEYIDRTTTTRFVPLPGSEAYANPKKYNLKGTHQFNGWDGNWSKFHVHHNHYHWWGSDSDYAELNKSYEMLYNFVDENWYRDYSINQTNAQCD